jgi:hypothetical protein
MGEPFVRRAAGASWRVSPMRRGRDRSGHCLGLDGVDPRIEDEQR